MIRRLVNIGVVMALLLGCGGGTLASALCPHAGCVKAAGPTASPAPEHADEALRDDHHAHSQEAKAGHHHEAPAEGHPADAPGSQSSLLNSHDSSCDHCMGRRPSTPASERERRSDGPKRDDRVAATPSSRPLDAPVADFVREITPHQGAPPGRASKHVLHSVLRI